MNISKDKIGSLTFLRDLEVLEGVYAPSEDSFLLLEYLFRIRVEGRRVLDMGAGSGIFSIYCAMKKAFVSAVDINPIAVQNIRVNAEKFGLSIKVHESNLFSSINETYDLILFNPPYTISQDLSDVAVDGGPNGKALIEPFLQALPRYLTDNGFALMIVSSVNQQQKLGSRQASLSFTTVGSKSLFFERLSLLRIEKRRSEKDSKKSMGF